MEALSFMLDVIVMVIIAYMGLRDDWRPPGTPQRSLFRTFDYDPAESVDGNRQRSLNRGPGTQAA